MKNKIKYFLLVFVFGTLLMSSCDDFLDKSPSDKLSSETYWSDERSADMALAGCYRLLNGDRYEEFMMFFDMATDIAFSQFPWDGFQDIGNGSVTDQSLKAYEHWSKKYAGIERSNEFIANIDEVHFVTPGLKERMLGEVRFLRAYQYSILIDLFGDVPLVKQPLTVDEGKTITRNPKSEVLDFILEDLTYAANNLPVTYPGSDYGRITKGAALALKARVELYNGKFSEAAIDAKAVMDLGVYQLFPNYEEQWWLANEGNAEIVLARNYEGPAVIHYFDAGVAPGGSQGGYAAIVPTKNIVDAYLCTDGLPISESPLYDPEDPFTNRDPRLEMSIIHHNSVFEMAQGGIDSIKIYTPGISKHSIGRPNASKTGYYQRKLLDPTAPNVWNMENDQILMRYAEVLLTYAEAKIEANQIDQSVFDALNLLRQRPSVNMPDIPFTNDQQKAREILRNERMVELAFEGHRYFDIRRWRIIGDVMPGALLGARILDNDGTWKEVFVENRNFSEKLYLLPIPRRERDLNPGLEQNPGY